MTVSLMGLPLGLQVRDAAVESPRDAGEDLGLRVALSALDAGQVGGGYSGGAGQAAEALATVFAPPTDLRSIGLHRRNDTHRRVTKQASVRIHASRVSELGI